MLTEIVINVGLALLMLIFLSGIALLGHGALLPMWNTLKVILGQALQALVMNLLSQACTPPTNYRAHEWDAAPESPDDTWLVNYPPDLLSRIDDVDYPMEKVIEEVEAWWSSRYDTAEENVVEPHDLLCACGECLSAGQVGTIIGRDANGVYIHRRN